MHIILIGLAAPACGRELSTLVAILSFMHLYVALEVHFVAVELQNHMLYNNHKSFFAAERSFLSCFVVSRVPLEAQTRH